MVNDQTKPDINEIAHEGEPEITDKKAREELIDMAAEQFARILWEQILYEERRRKIKKDRAE